MLRGTPFFGCCKYTTSQQKCVWSTIIICLLYRDRVFQQHTLHITHRLAILLTCGIMSTPSKPRHPRLRASCDGCFLAKVKCSKTRPICARCLSCGLMCQYSPSSRAGKPKPDPNRASHSNRRQDLRLRRAALDDTCIHQPPPDQEFPIDTGWPIPPTGLGYTMGEFWLPRALPMAGVGDGTSVQQPQLPGAMESYPATYPWTSSDTTPALAQEMSAAAPHIEGSQAFPPSFDLATIQAPMPNGWPDSGQHDVMSYFQGQIPPGLPAHHSAVINTTPIIQDTMNFFQNDGFCASLYNCVQSLSTLLTVSSHMPIPGHSILFYCQKAVEACNSMLTIGMRNPGINPVFVANFLAAVITQTASVSTSNHPRTETGSTLRLDTLRLDGLPNTGMTNAQHGMYLDQSQEGDENWLGKKLLLDEIRRFEEQFTKFRSTNTEALKRPEFMQDLLDNIAHEINSILEPLQRDLNPGFQHLLPPHTPTAIEKSEY
ncbi:hypothetical protein F4777DRAFT_498709 [Nemania sp. FL0916]|nr:hypothetical protein F4777DRAFT_498709 [Nemania sp. FL0916]